jgi:hypothetical protein
LIEHTFAHRRRRVNRDLDEIVPASAKAIAPTAQARLHGE